MAESVPYAGLVPSRAERIENSNVPAAERSWDEFYRAHWEWIFRLVRRLGAGQISVEDAVQDVFVVLVDRIDAFEGRSELRTWIYRVCLNVVAEHRRKGKRSERLSHAMNALRFWNTDDRSIERKIQSKQQLQLAQAALGAMSDKKRTVFVLAEIEGLSSEEIGAILSVPPATVRTRLHYARKEFTKRYQREERRG